MLTFFNNTAEDLGHTIQNLQDVSLVESNYLLQTTFNSKIKLLFIVDLYGLSGMSRAVTAICGVPT
jgi:hypothetical protein